VGSAFEAVFAFLFKYPARVFERGELVLAPAWPPPLVGLVALGALAVVTLTYRRVRTSLRRDRVILAVLRGAAVALLAACLLRPSLVLSSSVPQRNVLGILLDDSRSMRLSDVDGGTRLDAVRRVFADSAALVRALADRFALRFFRFAADAGPLANAAALTGAGTRTDLPSALEAAREELAGLPVAGLVLVTDGADNAGSDLAPPLLALQARRVPVYTVGVGQERFARDLAIERVDLPANALAGAGVLADAAVRIRGLGGRRTTITVEADGRLVATDELTLPARGDVARARVRLPALAVGTHRLTVRVRALEGETVLENNELHTVHHVRPGPEKVLYVEGEPRPEFAFTRRAVAGDSSLQVVGLLRSAQGKFLRVGVDDSLELAAGFPTNREELFAYRVIVLGSIEASFFTGDQLRMLADFVSRRGGGLLALGGRGALAEGGFAGTALGDVLPVTLDRDPADPDAPAIELVLRPTPAGLAHAALQLGASDTASTARWDSLPPLTTVNRLGALRPGATALLLGRPADGSDDAVPVLAMHRYGRGLAVTFGVQDSWLWQMHASVPLEDQTHETLWRQLLRWLLEGVPDRVEVLATPARAGPGEPVTLRARVADAAFLDVNDAAVVARVTTPSGRDVEVPLEWTLREDGSYAGRYVPEEPGVHRLVAVARRGAGADSVRLSAPGALLVDDHGADVAAAELRAPLLRRLADETGGRYYPLRDAVRLPDDVVYTESGITVREARDLWDMPAVFLVLLALLGTEWAYRRRRGLA
jgi:uncharacterized membrane protein